MRLVPRCYWCAPGWPCPECLCRGDYDDTSPMMTEAEGEENRIMTASILDDPDTDDLRHDAGMMEGETLLDECLQLLDDQDFVETD